MIKTNNARKKKSEYKSRMMCLINKKLSDIGPTDKRGASLKHAKDKRLELDEGESLSSIITQLQDKPSIPSYNRFFSLSPTNRLLHDKLLPNKLPQHFNKKTLVLDLDETLVHSWFQSFNPSDIILKVEFEKVFHDIHVLVRPGVDTFLNRMAKCFELVIFTASLSKYASPLLDILDPNHNCSYRLYRDHCTKINGVFVKDLKRLNRDLKDLILLDNSPISYAFNPENGFPITSWLDDKNDQELLSISPILEFLSNVHDVRVYIPKIVNNNVLSLTKANELISSSHYTKKEQPKNQNKLEVNFKPDSKKRKSANSNNISHNSKEININIVTNNYLNCFFNSNPTKEPQTVKNINIFRNTKTIMPNEVQTSKNLGEISQLNERERSFLNPQISKKNGKLSQYSSLLDRREKEIIHLNQQVNRSSNGPMSLTKPIPLDKLKEKDNLGMTQSSLNKSPSQSIILSSTMKNLNSKNKLRPSTSHSNLYPITSMLKNNSITPGKNTRPKSFKKENISQKLFLKTPVNSNQITPSTSLDSIFFQKKIPSSTKNYQQIKQYSFNTANLSKKKILIV